MKIKICGIRNKRDLEACEKAGADLIGFINIKRSKRLIEIDEIKKLTKSMKDQNKAVLVIEPSNMAEAEEKIKKSGLNNIQLHSLTPKEVREIKNNNPYLTVIPAIGIFDVINPDKKQEIEDFADICDYLLLDYQVQGKTGGTGRQIPSDTALEAAHIAKYHNENVKLFLAGGMNFERIKNEGEILANVFTFFDVNSGVEDAPGIKNTDRINELMKIKS